MKKSKILLAVLAGCAISSSAQAGTAVQTELSLLLDISGSVDANEYLLQRNGYVQAFQNAAVQSLVAQATNGVAVNMIMWSGATQQYEVVGWTHLTNAASCNAFANAISLVARPGPYNLTAPGSAINYAVGNNVLDIFNNGFDGLRQVIDVSGDGAENDGFNTATARNNALARGVDQINGLVIGDQNLANWYTANVKGGIDSFVVRVDSFDDFGNAIQNKILTELSPVPLPGVGGLACAGLGILAIRRRRNA